MTKLQDALTLIADAEERLRQAKRIVEKEAKATPEQWVGGLILGEILRDGGSVTRDRLHEIAQEHGMDNRGLGGFFTGKGSLQAITEIDRIILTPEGLKTARRYLQRVEAQAAEEESSTLAQAAEDAFAEDWGSEEDAAYDNL